MFFIFVSIPDGYRTQEMCDKVVSEDLILIVCYSDKYKTQRMCDEAVDDCLAVLKFIPDWFVTIKMIKNLFIALYADDNVLYFNDFNNFHLSFKILVMLYFLVIKWVLLL